MAYWLFRALLVAVPLLAMVTGASAQQGPNIFANAKSWAYQLSNLGDREIERALDRFGRRQLFGRRVDHLDQRFLPDRRIDGLRE